jgi:hypothetical protein
VPRARSPTYRETARRHIHWVTLKTYRGLYRSKKGDEVTVKMLSRPPATRVFRAATGRRKYKLVALHSKITEVIYVAKGTKNRKKSVDQEAEELAALEELEDDDEEEPELEDEDSEDDEDESDDEDEPAPKKGKKAPKSAPKESRAKADGQIGTAELAAHAGVDSRTLRMVLRKHKVEKDEESGQYRWKSLKDKEVVKILKLLKSGEAEKIKKESLDALKERQAEKKAGKEAGKKGKKSKKAKKVEEDEDDE